MMSYIVLILGKSCFFESAHNRCDLVLCLGDPPKPPPRPKRRNKMRVKNLQVTISVAVFFYHAIHWEKRVDLKDGYVETIVRGKQQKITVMKWRHQQKIPFSVELASRQFSGRPVLPSERHLIPDRPKRPKKGEQFERWELNLFETKGAFSFEKRKHIERLGMKSCFKKRSLNISFMNILPIWLSTF